MATNDPTKEINVGLPILEEEEVEETGVSTLRDRFRKRHEELQQEHHLDLEVPGYTFEDGAALLVRYKPLSGKQIEEGIKRARKAKGSVLVSASDTLIMACDSILVRQSEDAEPESIDPEDAVPWKFDERLVEFLDLRVPERAGSRQVLKTLFSSDAAIIDQAAEVSNWMTNVTEETDGEFLGK